MGLSQLISNAARKREDAEGRALAAHLRSHGIPEENDFGRILAVKTMFPRVTDADFDRVLTEARSATPEFWDDIMEAITGGARDAKVVKDRISQP